jgi:hypothetical protein
MAREHPDYRNIIEQLNTMYPGRELLTIEEVMKITGYTSRTSVQRYYGSGFKNRRITKAALARMMCN